MKTILVEWGASRSLPFIIKILLETSDCYVTSLSSRRCRQKAKNSAPVSWWLQSGRWREKRSPESLNEPVSAPVLASLWHYAHILVDTCFGTGLCEAPVMPLDVVSNRGGFYFQLCYWYRAGWRVNYARFFYASTVLPMMWLEDFCWTVRVTFYCTARTLVYLC